MTELSPVVTETLARAVCLAWADGDNDAMQLALLQLFLHLYGKAPVPAGSTSGPYGDEPDV